MPAKTKSKVATIEVPLTDDDVGMLRTILNTRKAWFLSVYLSLITMTLGVAYNSTLNFDMQNYTDTEHISKWHMYLVNVAWLQLIVLGSGTFIYGRKINPFVKDLRCGMKEKVPYQIIRKEYFPITNQYFVALNDTEYLHHEVDESFYNGCNDGDTIFLYRTIYARYVFEENGRFTLM